MAFEEQPGEQGYVLQPRGDACFLRQGRSSRLGEVPDQGESKRVESKGRAARQRVDKGLDLILVVFRHAEHLVEDDQAVGVGYLCELPGEEFVVIDAHASYPVLRDICGCAEGLDYGC